MNAATGFSLELKVTDRCNGRCFFCMNDDGESERAVMPAEEIAARLAQWSRAESTRPWRLKEVRMTGGEPLLELDTVLAIARACDEEGIASGINTNASLLDDAAVAALREAGLKTVKASLDAADEVIFRRMRGASLSLERTVDGIRRVRPAGLKLVIRFTLSQVNRDQLLPCYELARELGASTFQIKPLVRSGRAAASPDCLTRSEIRGRLSELRHAVAADGPEPVALCWPREDAAGLRAKTCGSLDKLYIAPDGEVTLCNYIAGDLPMGNLLREPLAEILGRRRIELVEGLYGHRFPAGCPQWLDLSKGHAPLEADAPETPRRIASSSRGA